MNERRDRPDFEAEGFLDGLEGEAREARLRLLTRLFEAGIGLEELREAVQQDRLVLVPAERALGEPSRYTAEEIGERTGVPIDFFQAVLRANGLVAAEPGERAYSERDLEAARIMSGFYESGWDRQGMLEVARVLGRGLAQTADAMGELFGRTFIRAGVSEEELALRNAEAAGELLPRVTPLIEYVLRRHMRERLRHQAVSQAMLESGELPGTRDVGVAFIDMVSFTRLGEGMRAEEVGDLAGRLGAMAAECASPPVRLVKMIGDAAMLASPDAGSLVEAVFDLLAAADRADEGFPKLRAGAAYGPALGRSGDWYGRTVNVASRITDLAEPETFYATSELCAAAGNAVTSESIGSHHLKGIEDEVEMFRIRRRQAGERDA